jgi:chromosome segregation ATPase
MDKGFGSVLKEYSTMFFSTKGLLRWGLISAAVVGGTTILVGPERVAAGFDQVRTMASHVVEDFVDDPVALRRQLQGLADQYPDRITEVRGEIAQIDIQIDQLNHDNDVADRVISLTSDDLEEIRVAVVDAEVSMEAGQKVAIRRGSFRVNIDQARSEARRIAGIKANYQDRLNSNDQQVSLISNQRERLSDILGQLEDEYGQFEEKLWVLDRQIDAIERNDRLITMTEEQQAILRDYEKLGKVGNLRQLESKLEELRITQEAQLQALEKHGVKSDYERRAREDIQIGDEMYLLDSSTDDLAWMHGN